MPSRFYSRPGRVTILGEGDGNRLRRIYTDGRPHPADPDPSFHGHSIGHWEGDTLVVDTVGLLPQAYLAVNEAVGVPNNGDMHIVERLHLQGPDTLADDLQITANKVLSSPGAPRANTTGSGRGSSISPKACARRVHSPMPSTRTAIRFSHPSSFTMEFQWDRIRNEACNFRHVMLSWLSPPLFMAVRRWPRHWRTIPSRCTSRPRL